MPVGRGRAGGERTRQRERGPAASSRAASASASESDPPGRSAAGCRVFGDLMKAKLGIAPIAWWNDDLAELSDDVSLEECLRQAQRRRLHRHGDGPPLPHEHGGARPDPRALRHRPCAAAGSPASSSMATSSVRRTGSPSRWPSSRPPVRPASSMARPRRSIQGDRSKPLATKPKLSEDEIKAYGRKMTAFGEWCADQGMPISYHHHMAAAIETEDRARPAHEAFRRGPAAALRRRPHGLRRRRRAAGHRQAPCPHLAMSTPRTCAWP